MRFMSIFFLVLFFISSLAYSDLIPGDANGDGVVSSGDYIVVQMNFGNTSTLVPESSTIFLLGLCGIFLNLRHFIIEIV